MKKTETREQTLERLARDARQGAGATKSFEAMVRRVAITPLRKPVLPPEVSEDS